MQVDFEALRYHFDSFIEEISRLPNHVIGITPEIDEGFQNITEELHHLRSRMQHLQQNMHALVTNQASIMD
jgi:uncharacterized protein (DUF342 family)